MKNIQTYRPTHNIPSLTPTHSYLPIKNVHLPLSTQNLPPSSPTHRPFTLKNISQHPTTRLLINGIEKNGKFFIFSDKAKVEKPLINT